MDPENNSETPINQSEVERKIQFAQAGDVDIVIKLLNKCRTPIVSIVADSQFQTLVNALTLEAETKLIQEFASYIGRIREGELHNGEKK